MARTYSLDAVGPDHPDFAILDEIKLELIARAGGREELLSFMADMLREEIDKIIDTPNSARRFYGELEKTEKTYIGTRVEIRLRNFLKVEKGRRDLKLTAGDVDVKNTMGSNWTIPPEAIGVPCLLLSAAEPVDEKTNKPTTFKFGLVLVRDDYLLVGKNRDAKKGLSANGFENVNWIAVDHPYPNNFWRTVPAEKVQKIFAGSNGNDRMMNLFRLVQRTPISRRVVESVAQQKDPTRRIRKGGGARDQAEAAGLLILSQTYDQAALKAFSLPPIRADEWISFEPNAAQMALWKLLKRRSEKNGEEQE